MAWQLTPQFPIEEVKLIVQFTPARPDAQMEPHPSDDDTKFTAPPIPKHEEHVDVVGSELLRMDTDKQAAGLMTFNPVKETKTLTPAEIGDEVEMMT